MTQHPADTALLVLTQTVHKSKDSSFYGEVIYLVCIRAWLCKISGPDQKPYNKAKEEISSHLMDFIHEFTPYYKLVTTG